MAEKPVVGVIGGIDSCGAAGLAIDIQAMTHMGSHAAPIVTALTAQTLNHVNHVECVDLSMLRAQMEALMGLSQLRAFKIGMLGSGLAVKTISNYLRSVRLPLVVDPVLSASAGRSFLDEDGIKSLCQNLLPMVTLLTPNIPEAEVLTGQRITSSSDLRRAARRLREMGPKAVVIKGGHDRGEMADDFVMDDHGEFWLSSIRQPQSVRGTGCAFASVAAAAMASGHDLREAVVMAKAYLARGISLSYSINGGGPRVLSHGLWPTRHEDFPLVRSGIGSDSLDRHFPPIEPSSIGFYPIVPRASWVELLAYVGVKTIQLRLKDLPMDVVERDIAQATATARRFGTQLFINDHWDLAIKYESFGVHLGQEDLLSADMDQLIASGIRLGISTHSYFEAAVAHGIRPSYVALGPIFPTTCKSMGFGPQGFSRVGEWRRLLPYPIVAIGGLRPEHASELKRQGAAGFAVISDWLNHSDPQQRVKQWLMSAMS